MTKIEKLFSADENDEFVEISYESELVLDEDEEGEEFLNDYEEVESNQEEEDLYSSDVDVSVSFTLPDNEETRKLLEELKQINYDRARAEIIFKYRWQVDDFLKRFKDVIDYRGFINVNSSEYGWTNLDDVQIIHIGPKAGINYKLILPEMEKVF